MAPRTPLWSRDPLAVQRHAIERGSPLEILTENSSDDVGFDVVDVPIAASRFADGIELPDHVIAETWAAARLTVFDPAAQATPRLVCEILQEDGVHRSLETDVKMRDVAFGKRHDPDSSERHPLEETDNVFLVTAEPA